MKKTIDVLIIEDDFWIAGIHEEIVDSFTGFNVSSVAKSGTEALHYLNNCKKLPQMILLDIYIPDTEGLNLFKTLRSTFSEVDIIVITAADDKTTILNTRQYGAFDYIIKPVDKSRLTTSLKTYKQYYEFIHSKQNLTQAEVDKIFHFGSFSPGSVNNNQNNHLPKGIDPLTLQEITSFLTSDIYEPMTATEISKALGMSRSTVRRYTEYLVSVNKAEAVLNYGNVGRPLRQYIYHEQNEQNET
ncbi:response regulator [Pseudogracilibacillus sp. SE30717A]|uniref:response regulator n=1 Tax=Pseudogracilibacillus sp. SE30717A TaxID=3098293 RepID=UPI00300E13DE